MKCLPKILITAMAGIGALACVHQSPDLDDCETGLRLLFDWIGTSAPRSDTDSLNVRVAGSAVSYSFMAATTGRELDVLPGSYRFTAWETAQNITVDGTTLMVASTDSLAADPQQFTAGTTTDRVERDRSYQEIHVPMYRQTRDLIIRMRFTGDGVPLIRSATGIVSGISLTRDIIYGFPPVDGRLRPVSDRDGKVSYDFTAAEDGWFVGRRTLLGIDGDNDQFFSVTVGFDEEHHAQESVEITADLNLFHTENVEEPWVISLVMDIGVTLEMTIVDWYSGAESWMDAE